MTTPLAVELAAVKAELARARKSIETGIPLGLFTGVDVSDLDAHIVRLRAWRAIGKVPAATTTTPQEESE